MNKLAVFLFALGSVSVAGCASFETQRGQVGLQLGHRMLDEDDWAPVEDQTSIGIDLALLNEDGFGGELGFAYSFDDTDLNLGGTPVDLEASVAELYGGLRKAWALADGRAQPYVGAGLSLVQAEIEASSDIASEDADDTSVGLYLRGGFDYFITPSFFAGVDARYLFLTDIEFSSAVEGDVDGLLLALRIGYAF